VNLKDYPPSKPFSLLGGQWWTITGTLDENIKSSKRKDQSITGAKD